MRRSDSSTTGASTIASSGNDVFPPPPAQADPGTTQMAAKRNALPGFGLSLGYAVTYLSLLVLIPLGACFARAASLSPRAFVAAVWSERARAAYSLTFGASLAAALLNVVLGMLVAWVLVRYRFPF